MKLDLAGLELKMHEVHFALGFGELDCKVHLVQFQLKSG